MKKAFFIVISFLLFTNAFTQIINLRDGGMQDFYQPSKESSDATKPILTQPKERTRHKKDTIINTNRTNIIQIGAGGLLTSLNFFKNAQTFTYYPAISFRMYYQPNNYIRFVADYTKVQEASIAPTWLNVRNTYFDIDANFLMHFIGSAGIAYFILGASSQSWKSYYTGVDDYNSTADAKIQPNTNYKATYFGANIGVGFEFKILPRFDMYGEVRYRVSYTDVGFGLSDVCYGVGVKYTLLDFNPKVPHKKPSKHFKWF